MSQVILHIDDDPDMRDVVATVLDDAGYTVLNFATVKDALHSLETCLPDLILLDVMVEEQDSGLLAYDLLAKQFPEIPSIILTSLGEMVKPYFSDRIETVTVLEKPVVPERLLAIIRARLGKSEH